MFRRIFIYTHRRMAITADDVSLEDIVPISLDFAVVEGEAAFICRTSIKKYDCYCAPQKNLFLVK